jgi:predicted kinase
MLVLIAGLPGTGKTTLAAAYAEADQLRHFNSDALRNELHLRGKYSPTTKQKVYDELLARTRKALVEGVSVVVDSTFHQWRVQQAFILLAKELSTPLYWIEVTASEATLRERLVRPRSDSEADFSVYEQIRDSADPLPPNRLQLNTEEGSLLELIEQIRRYITKNGKGAAPSTH